MKQDVILGTEAREGLIRGIEKLSSAVIASLGVSGRNILFMKNGEVVSTKDGVSIAKEFKELKDPLEDMGAKLIKEAAIGTATGAGDGTTTSTLLAYEMVINGSKLIGKSENAVKIKKDIDNAVSDVMEHMSSKIAKEISSSEELRQIATISANNDSEIGDIISTVIETAGVEGVIHIEESKSNLTYIDTVEGMQFNKGYNSPYFVTNNNTMESVLDNPFVLIYDGNITAAKEILKVLEYVSGLGRSLLIIADDVSGEALATLIVNKVRGTLKVCAVKAPDFGDRRKLVLEDIAITTGGKVVSKEKGMSLDKLNVDVFGEAKVVTINKETTTIVDGKGKEEDIESRAAELKTQIENASSPYEIEKLNERLSKFSGGVSIIYVGGDTETEMGEKKDRVDDALHAAKAAYAEGIVPGGGVALLYSRESIKNRDTMGGRLVYEACGAPFKQILKNAGFNTEEVLEKQYHLKSKTNQWLGYNIRNNKFVDMGKEGIIDPMKVTRNALKNAASVASTILLTEGVIINEKEDNPSQQGVDPGMFM